MDTETSEFPKAKVVECAEEVRLALLEQHEIRANAGVVRHGFLVHVANTQPPLQHLVRRRFGPYGNATDTSCFQAAEAEVANLASYPDLDLGHYCRDEGNEGKRHYYGAAVRIEHLIFVVVGWGSPDLNELHTILTALRFGSINIARARDLLRKREPGTHRLSPDRVVLIRRNPYAHLLYDVNSCLAA